MANSARCYFLSNMGFCMQDRKYMWAKRKSETLHFWSSVSVSYINVGSAALEEDFCFQLKLLGLKLN